MTATYPSGVVNFGPLKANFVDTILAADPNTLREEVVAIEAAIGTTPGASTVAVATGWRNDGFVFSSVVSRLANIEKGIVADSHPQYLKVSGGSNVQPAAGTVGLSITAATGQTANLQEWKDSSGTVITKIGPDGYLYINNTKVTVTIPDPSSLLLGGM